MQSRSAGLPNRTKATKRACEVPLDVTHLEICSSKAKLGRLQSLMLELNQQYLQKRNNTEVLDGVR